MNYIKLYNIQPVPKFKLNNKTYDFGPADTLESSCFGVSWDTVLTQGALYSTIAKSFRLWLFCLLAL